jgi:hypothetical protein
MFAPGCASWTNPIIYRLSVRHLGRYVNWEDENEFAEVALLRADALGIDPKVAGRLTPPLTLTTYRASG